MFGKKNKKKMKEVHAEASIFKPKLGYFTVVDKRTTLLLLFLLVMFNAFVLVMPDYIPLIKIYNLGVLDGDFLWTLVTATFVSGDLADFIFDVVAILLLGLCCEAMMGKRFFFYFIVMGVVINIANLFYMTYVVGGKWFLSGPSGVIYSLFPIVMIPACMYEFKIGSCRIKLAWVLLAIFLYMNVGGYLAYLEETANAAVVPTGRDRNVTCYFAHFLGFILGWLYVTFVYKINLFKALGADIPKEKNLNRRLREKECGKQE